MNHIIYKIVKTLGKPIFRLLYRPEFIGVENIPNEGPVILAGNHTDNFDAALMISGPKRRVHMLAKMELFSSRIGAWFFRSMGCISVNRNIHDETAKEEAISVLENNNVIGIFPEGTAHKNGIDLLPFKYGAVSFANKTGALIVPFAITGKYILFKKSIKITYGLPYKSTGDLDSDNKILEDKVKKLMLEGDENYKKDSKIKKRKKR